MSSSLSMAQILVPLSCHEVVIQGKATASSTWAMVVINPPSDEHGHPDAAIKMTNSTPKNKAKTADVSLLGSISKN